MDESEILRRLQERKNVLLMGAPGSGKSRLMNRAARAFEAGAAIPAVPVHYPGAAVPIPAVPAGTLPMLRRRHRKVFRTALHQNSKYRDFLTGIVPRLDGSGGYEVCEGILYRANEFAKRDDSAALLIIDELNRGPAVEVFGGSIAAIEPDKRLAEDNSAAPGTQYFEILHPAAGANVEYAFSPHLYILAAINQADVSVAPLDVAFLRRWMTVPLNPDYQSLYDAFNIDRTVPPPEDHPAAADVYHAAVRALEAVNRKIVAGRGAEYQLGQGVFLSGAPRGTSVGDALDFVLDCWMAVYAHIEELFFGEPHALAYLLNAGEPGSPYALEEIPFAGDVKYVLTHAEISRDTIYGLYLALQRDGG